MRRSLRRCRCSRPLSMNSVFVIVVFSYVLVLNGKICRPASWKVVTWLLSSILICIAFYLWLLYSAWCNYFFTFVIKHGRFCNTLGESVVCYNSVSFTSVKLQVPLQRHGLSSMRGLPLVGKLKWGSCLLEGRAWLNGCCMVDAWMGRMLCDAIVIIVPPSDGGGA